MHYGACPKKIESREQTIINTYRKHYKRDSIPNNTQYWTICGRCSYQPNQLEQNCEPDQIIKSKLANPDQIHGVEIDPEIYKYNINSGINVNWYLGDFYETMVEFANNNNFNPAIINADLLHMPDHAATYLSKIMQFLSHFDGQTMIVCNMVKCICNSRNSDINDMIYGLEKEPCFQNAFSKAKWSFHNEYYWYNGTGKTTTKMMTLIMFKNP